MAASGVTEPPEVAPILPVPLSPSAITRQLSAQIAKKAQPSLVCDQEKKLDAAVAVDVDAAVDVDVDAAVDVDVDAGYA